MATPHVIVFLFGFVGLVICAVTIPRMIIDGMLSGIEAAVLFALMILLIIGAATLSRIAPRLSTALICTFVFTLGSLPHARFRLRDRGNRAITKEDMERCRQAIAFDERMVAAHVALGKGHATLGDYAQAIPCFERALDLEPENEEAKRGLAECLRLQSALRGETWLCHICGSGNDPKDTKCFQCQTPRGRVPRASRLHDLLLIGFVSAEVVILALLLAGFLRDFAAFGWTALISGVFYLVYSVDPSGDL